VGERENKGERGDFLRLRKKLYFFEEKGEIEKNDIIEEKGEHEIPAVTRLHESSKTL
jgi:hypothetical protein